MTIADWSGKYDFLRNDYPVDICVGAITYPSVEHAFQAAKTDVYDDKLKISILSVKEAIQYGRSCLLKDGWGDIKLDVMKDLLLKKFSDKDLCARLVDTEDEEIVMSSRKDDFWGTGIDGIGANHLGELLMEIREEKMPDVDKIKLILNPPSSTFDDKIEPTKKPQTSSKELLALLKNYWFKTLIEDSRNEFLNEIQKLANNANPKAVEDFKLFLNK